MDRARKAWSDQLIDRSRRNNLLYFRDLKTGTLDFSGADASASSALLNGASVPLLKLLPAGADEVRSLAVARAIHRRALENLEERGLETLYLALGMATWAVSDGGRPPDAPVLLVPLRLEWKGREDRSATVQRKGELQINPVLLNALELEQGCAVTAETLLGAGESGDAPDGGEEDAGEFQAEPVYARLREEAGSIPGFGIRDRAVLGNFSFQKMAMVRDLLELGEQLSSHDVIAALAGDPEAQAAVRSTSEPVDQRELDRVPASDEFLVLDADASQEAVVAAVQQGQHLVIQGPPGTGKSQTIANLITTLAARGRRILFVAEKRAALEVVLGRLETVGLGHLALDLHGADLSRRAVMERLGQTLQRVREALPVDTSRVHREFEESRARLNQHVARVHAPRQPSGLSVYEIEGRLLRAPEATRAATRWRGPDLERLDAGTASAITQLLREAAGFGHLFVGDDPSPWTGARLTDGAAVQQALDAVSRIQSAGWPRAMASLGQVLQAAQLPHPAALEDAERILGLLDELSATLQVYAPELLQEDLPALAWALAPAGGRWLRRVWAGLTDASYRRARDAVRKLRKDPKAADASLLIEVAAAAEQVRSWREEFPGRALPGAPVEVASARRDLDALLADLALLEGGLGQPRLKETPVQALLQQLSRLAADSLTPHRIPRLLQIERELQERGADAILKEIRSRKPGPALWPDFFEFAWLASCFDQARLSDPQVAGFNGRSHEEHVRTFRETDVERVRLTAGRVRRAHAENVVRVMNANPEQEALVRRETEKKSRHLPLRTLLAKAPEVLTALAPCWMASPLSVSQLLAGDRRYFDVAIFDEASQVLPHDAVPSLLRASQAVVAGDEHQLPPTLFFADGSDEEEAGEEVLPTAGFESLLQLLRSAVERPLPLEWHYRSRDESLIAFSNQQVYRPHGQELITFPGPGSEGAIRHVLVPQPVAQDGQEESVSDEVRRVVELVLEHAETRPDETLGVIAMGIKHARRVEAALDEALRSRPDLDEFFDESRAERFFVKNLERVQGDERDAILLTIGYGKDRSGRLSYRFGPLNQEGGHRRLNVAVTRARRRMTLVSSFDHHDMDPNRSQARGVQLLRLYLQFAASGGKVLGDAGRQETPLNLFEADIYEALSRRGMSLVPQWGASRYRIDLVAQHPQKPGRFVLAIECDGASYHSAPTARDRDRLRQQQLEALGWRFHRIWSTDWFMRRSEEIERAWQAYQAAVSFADQQDARAASVPERTAQVTPAIVPERQSAAAPRREPRPPVPHRDSITEYAPAELRALIAWIESDGRLRTNDELIDELVRELGFRKRGARIVKACEDAIRQVRAAGRRG